MNVALTGFMASGKTEIGKKLADILDYTFTDTDELIEMNEGMTINEIFAVYGEEYFRRSEHEQIKRAAESDKNVISTGGGVVLNKRNMDELRRNSVIINLAPSFETIKKRLSRAKDTRPLLKDSTDDDIQKRFISRMPFYDDCDIKLVVSDEKTPAEYAEEIADMLKKYNRN